MSVLSVTTQRQVEKDIVDEGILTPEKMAEIRAKAKELDQPLFSVMVSEGYVTNEVLTKTIARVTKMPYVNLTNAVIDPKILSQLPKELAERYMAVPLGEMKNRLVVAMLDADNVQAVDFLSNKIGLPLKVYAASEEGIQNVLRQYKGDISHDVNSVLNSQMKEQEERDEKKKDKDVKVIINDSPISKALSSILEYAAKNRASDIHIEPLEKELKIRARVDGVLREIMHLPKTTEAPLVSRIKILSNLKIDEHRTPQDGQFSIAVGGQTIDLRIAISPVVWGEQVVIRLLDKSGTSLKLEDMGYVGRALRTIRKGLERPNGMILTSGPTGSGKSTSLYALIQEIISDQINIVTLEDPVEYKMPGINQIQVNADVGLTFASGLRSILRQDPDVVMVGEIRDKETAQLAVQAALTGHLVFSTLHTNSAAGILPRLLDMGIEPFLIASTVHTVIGQRLVRRNIDEREAYNASKAEIDAIHATLGGLLPKKPEEAAMVSRNLGYSNLPLANQNAYTLYKGKSSLERPDGFKGRMGLYEVFEVSEAIQSLILKRSTSTEIQKLAQAEGMVTMREDGYLKALSGMTTLTEINRVAAEDAA
ncbi:MAG TPA: ATPase, T2SS/T4P/T4SS family [Candidatus Saccharibacteria bacterium]|jgi:type IV pilus assembly protein PilB|nr:ATPase, T2SS/T4P/T4SS family [Candidatus Saccharibacteria bacterium]HMT55347.1 ATPase, T2SS/T4P/T4SS family [Candidatus Saccharibacteria bacterium]